MQRVALRAQLAASQREAESARRIADRRGGLLEDAMAALRLARAGLLIALTHVDEPRARLLIGCALDRSELPGAR